MQKRLFILFLFSVILLPLSFGQTPDFHAMLVEIDKTGNFDNTDFSCVYTIV